MKSIKPVEPTTPTTLPFAEHNARRRRAKVVPTPGKANQSHSAPHRPGTRKAGDAASLLSTYSQFPSQSGL